MTAPTIYEYAGGAAAFSRLTHEFYAKVRHEPMLAPLFADFSENHIEGVALWLGEVFGGPPRYSERRGGYPTMVSYHVGLSLTEDQRSRWAELMIATAREVLPDDSKLQARFRSYVEWGTHIAWQNSQPGYDPPAEAGIPLWSWGKDGPPEE